MATPGPINRNKTQENDARYQRARNGRMDSWQASIERAEKRRLEKLKAQQEAALQAQRASLQGQRDKQQQKYGAENANRQANNALGAANADFQNQQRLNDEQRRAVGQRDKRLNQFETDENRRKNRDLRERDQRQFGYTMAENEQQFGNQLERDYRQQGYTLDRDRLQGDQTLQRDFLQGGIQADRDERLNQFGAEEDFRRQRNTLERDTLQNDFQSERDARLNIFDTQRDVRRQQFEQVNIYQQQAAEIGAKWQEQVAIAKDNGFDFSPAQREEMKQLEKAFRKNVLSNSDLPEDMRERAMVEHQKQMSSFVPEERVVQPQDRFQQSIVQDEQTGQRFLVIQDPRGGVKYEPLDGGMGDQSGQMRQDAMEQEKKAKELRKLTLDREKAMQSLINEVRMETDENGERIPRTPEEIDAEVLKRFAADELYYTDSGLPQHDMYRMKAERDQQKQQLTPQPKPPGVNPFKPQPTENFTTGAAYGQSSPATEPVVVSSTNLAEQIKAAKSSGNSEAAKALTTISDLNRQLGGKAPEEGSEEMETLIEALKIIRKNGFSVEPKAAPRQESGPFYDGAMAFPG